MEQDNFHLYIRYYLVPKMDLKNEDVESITVNQSIYEMDFNCSNVESAVKAAKNVLEEFESRFVDDFYFELFIKYAKLIHQQRISNMIINTNELWKIDNIESENEQNGGIGPFRSS